MKSSTSRSDLPASSCAWIWFLRSTASGAFDSAIVWFWHTRQRSSWARAAARLSMSCAWAIPGRRRSSNRTLATRELLHERHDLVLHHVGGQRADLLEADDALLVDDVGLRHAVDAV